MTVKKAMRKRLTPKQMQTAVDRFNAKYPVGSRIKVWRGAAGIGPGIETTVEAPGAFVLSGHTPVVKVPGDCIALTHTRPV